MVLTEPKQASACKGWSRQAKAGCMASGAKVSPHGMREDISGLLSLRTCVSSFADGEPRVTPWAPPVAQRVKRLPATQGTWARSLGLEDPLEKEMATHSRTLAWKIPWIEEPGRPQSMGSQRLGHD